VKVRNCRLIITESSDGSPLDLGSPEWCRIPRLQNSYQKAKLYKVQ
jgi:hypothetical protein